MSILPAQSIKRLHQISDHVSLAIRHRPKETEIKLICHTPFLSTCDLPKTYEILEKHLPEIFFAKCYNGKRLSFAEEVKDTELGHLFEHILLAYLFLLKNKITPYRYDGVTKWNWEKKGRGVFDIFITSGYEDIGIFQQALQKTLTLFLMLLSSYPFHKEKTDGRVYSSVLS